MHSVTADAVRKFLSLPVWFVTFHAVGNVTVFVVMTDCAVETTMGTGVVFYLTYLCGVTGITNGNVVFTKYNSERLVRILMAAKAVVYLKMSPAFMALGTLGDNLFLRGSGGMTAFMAVKAPYFRFVFPAVGLILMDNFRMTFYAVAVFQYRIPGPGFSW